MQQDVTAVTEWTFSGSWWQVQSCWLPGEKPAKCKRSVLDQAAKDSAKCPVWGGVGMKIVSGEHGRTAAKDCQGTGTLEKHGIPKSSSADTFL